MSAHVHLSLPLFEPRKALEAKFYSQLYSFVYTEGPNLKLSNNKPVPLPIFLAYSGTGRDTIRGSALGSLLRYDFYRGNSQLPFQRVFFVVFGCTDICF